MVNNDKDIGVIPLCEGDDDDGEGFQDDEKNRDIPHFFKDSKECC